MLASRQAGPPFFLHGHKAGGLAGKPNLHLFGRCFSMSLRVSSGFRDGRKQPVLDGVNESCFSRLLD